MSLNKIIAISILFVLSPFRGIASHILGGELDMQHLQGDRYEVTLKLYFDGLNGQDVVENIAIISSFRKSDHTKIEDFNIFKIGDYEIAGISNELCNDGINIRIYTFKTALFLDPLIYDSNEGYYISWQRCCRSDFISNLPLSGTTGYAFYLEFPDLDRFAGNSSPKFSSINADYYCTGQSVRVNMSASDIDGDDLRYSVVAPLVGSSSALDNSPIGRPGPYAIASNYSSIPSSSGLSIDNNGNLRFNASAAGIYLVAVLCEEFRNGEKIGEVRREFSILVRNCEQNSAPRITLFPFEGNTPYRVNDTILIKTNTDLCHTIRVSDPDQSEFLSISLAKVNFFNKGPDFSPKAAVLQGDVNFFESTLCFEDCFDPVDTYFEFRLTVRDDNCPLKAEDNLLVKMQIVESENRPPQITTDFVSDDYKIGDEIQFTVTASDPDSGDFPEINLSAESFDPTFLGMNLVQNNNGRVTTGLFNWRPDCENLLDVDQYELLFTSTDNNCGKYLADSLTTDVFVEKIEKGLFENNRAPNVITPNGDGLNEVFTLPLLNENECISEEFGKIEIFNRWGKRVFKSEDQSFEWRPEGFQAGEYFYLIQFSESSFKGYLHLLP